MKLATVFYFLVLLALVFATGCGTRTEQITVQGQPGAPGQDGYSIVAKTINNPELCGVAGGSQVLLALDMNRDLQMDENDVLQTQYVTCNGRDGVDGEDGSDGQDGRDGLNGTSCTVNKVGTVSTITCGTASVNVLDGAKGDKGDRGETGPQGPMPSGIYITEIINPCGVEFNNEEVFLRLSTGRILALYDGGPHEDRLALIAPGNYITTDRNQNRACAFTITSDYQITNERVQ